MGAHLHDGSRLGARVLSFHRMEAKPSGESTEYTACSCMATRLATASRQCAARTAFAQKHGYHGNLQARHGHQIVGDGVALAALLGLGAAEGALRVNETENGAAELLRLAHEAQRLAVPFRLRAAEVAADALLEVLALLLSDDGDGTPPIQPMPPTMAPSSANLRSPCSSTNPSTKLRI